MFNKILSRGLFAALVAISLLLTACNLPAEKFNNTGKARTLADFKGKVVVMFFGYTQCPDVCPTTMVEMAGVMKQLGAQADKVQVIFVTIDPERYTQALLASYVPNFDSRFLGMY